jgi:hypothetical protein
LPKDFSTPFFAPKFSPPTYLPPPTSLVPTYLNSFCIHSIVRAWENLKREGKRGKVELSAISGRAKLRAKSKKAELIARKKRLKWTGKSRKVELRAKSEKADRELEGKLFPFSGFFVVVFLHVLSSLCLRRKRRWHCVTTFLSMFEKKKMTTV